MNKADEATLKDVVEQLKINNVLLAAQLKANNTIEHHSLVMMLANAGASNGIIAEILQTTPDAVRMAVQRERTKQGG